LDGVQRENACREGRGGAGGCCGRARRNDADRLRRHLICLRISKSLLAARYVHQNGDDYDIVAWIRAEDGGTADLSELAVELGLPVAVGGAYG